MAYYNPAWQRKVTQPITGPIQQGVQGYITQPKTAPFVAPFTKYYPTYKPYVQKPSYVADYNNPHEINSMADIIMGTFSNSLNRPAWAGAINNIPLLNMIPATLQSAWDKGIMPLSQGDLSTFAINQGINLMETLDVFSNPIKGLVFGGSEGFNNALGLGEQGRVNYNSNSGNIFIDFATEVLCDPGNWVTLFAKTPITGFIKGGLEKGLTGALGEIALKKGFKEGVLENTFKKVVKESVGYYMAGKTGDLATTMATLIKRHLNLDVILDARIIKSVMDETTKVVENGATLTILNGLKKVVKVSDSIDSALMKTAFTSASGLYPIVKTVDKLTGATDMGSKFIKNMYDKAYSVVVKKDVEKSIVDMPGMLQAQEHIDNGIVSVMRFAKANDLPAETVAPMLRTSASQDLLAMQQLVDELVAKGADQTDILKAIDATFEMKYKEYGVDTLPKYIELMKEAGKYVGNDFDELVVKYTDFYEEIKIIQNAKNYIAQKEALQVRGKVLKDLIDTGYEKEYSLAIKDYQRDVQELEDNKLFTKTFANIDKDIAKATGNADKLLAEARVFTQNSTVFKNFAKIPELFDTQVIEAQKQVKTFFTEPETQVWINSVTQGTSHSTVDILNKVNEFLQHKNLKTVADFQAYKNSWDSLHNALANLDYLGHQIGKDVFPVGKMLPIDVVKVMQQADPEFYVKQFIQIQAGEIHQSLKLEQVYSNLYIMGDKAGNDIISEIATETGVGEFFVNLATLFQDTRPEFAKACANVLNSAKQYAVYVQLISKIQKLGVGEEVRVAILSSIQNYALRDVNKIMDNFDYYYKDILRKIESYYNESYVATHPLKLSYYANRYGLVQPHTAVGDTCLDVYMAQQELKSEIEKLYPGRKILAGDNETNKLARGSGQTLEMSLTEYDSVVREGNNLTGTSFNFIRKLDDVEYQGVVPQDRVLKIICSEGKTPFERVSIFRKRYMAEDGLAHKEMYEQFLDKLDTYGEDVVLMYHNGEDFDIPFMIAKMAQLDIDPIRIAKFKKLTKIDTLKMLRKKAGYLTLSEDTKRELAWALISQGRAVRDLGISNKFLDSGARDLNLHLQKFMKTVKSTKDLQISEVAPGLAKAKYISDNFIERFSHLKELNRGPNGLENVLIKKSGVTNLFSTPNMLQDLMDVTGLTAKELEERYSAFPNLTKVLFRDNVDTINYLGYKNTITHDLIKEYFDVVEGEFLDPRLARIFSSVAQGFDNMYKRINHVEFLTKRGIASDIKKLLVDLHESTIVQGSLSRSYLSRLRTNKGDIVSDFILVQKLYTKLQPTDLIARGYNADLIELLKNPNPLYTPLEWGGGSADFLRIPNPRSYMQEIETVEQYEKSLQELHDNQVAIHSLQKLDKTLQLFGDNLDVHELYAVNNMMPSSALRGTVQLLNDVDEFYNLESYVEKSIAGGALKENPFLTSEDLVKMAEEQFGKFMSDNRETLNNLLKQQVVYLTERTPAELVDLMAWHAPWIEFDVKDLLRDEKISKNMMAFISNKNGLEEAGIHMELDGSRIYLVLDHEKHGIASYVDSSTNMKMRKVTRNGVDVPVPNIPELTLEGTPWEAFELASKIKQNRQQILNITVGASAGTVGDLMSKRMFEGLYNQLPVSVQKLLPSLDVLTYNANFVGPKFNFMNIGTVASRHAKEQYLPNDLFSIIAKSNEEVIQKTHAENLYLDYWTEGTTNINNLGRTDAELLTMLQQSPEFTLMVIAKDEKLANKGLGYNNGGYKIVQVKPKTLEDIAFAKKWNANLVPAHVYSAVFEKLNTSLFEEGQLKLWQRIVYAYKVGFLLDPGVWIRNYADSTMKAMIDTKSILGIIQGQWEATRDLKKYTYDLSNILNIAQMDVKLLMDKGVDIPRFVEDYAKNRFNAINLLNKYNLTMNDVIKMDKNARFTKENLNLYFEKMNSALDLQTFNTLHNLFTSGPTVGMFGRWEKYYKDINDVKNAHVQGLLDSGVISPPVGDAKSAMDELWDSFVHFSNIGMKPNQWVEQINRVGQFMTLQEHKLLNNTQRYYRIEKTHFDYALKSDLDRAIETVIPFYTFTKRNTEYWINAVSENPWLARMLGDYLNVTWDLDDGTKDLYELQNNMSLQNQLLSGAIPLFNSNMTLKMNPSFMDTFNLLTDPLGSVVSRMIPPVKMGITEGAMQGGASDTIINALGLYKPRDFTTGMSTGQNWKDLMPILGVLNQRYGLDFQGGMSKSYYDRTGNPLNKVLPGIFGATKRFNSPGNFKTFTPYPKRYSPKKAKKAYVRKPWVNYPKKYYPKFASKSSFTSMKDTRQAYHANAYMEHPVASRTSESFFSRLYTKKGRSRLEQLTAAPAVSHLQFKLIDMQRYFR